jgi:hypothetical protein
MTELATQDRRLALLSDLEISGNLTIIGFTLPAEISYEQYEAIGRMFGTAHEALKFAIGDWLLQGQQIFNDDVFQAAEGVGISRVSLMQYVRVSERIPRERRNAQLTWSHHRAVASFPEDEQDLWLNRAAASGWSKTELEDHLRSQREEPTTTVSQHERRLPGVMQAIADAAEKVYQEGEWIDDGTFSVPRAPVVALAASLGIVETA